ncbi:unnamed protein product [Didymodactylos carnosus]|uniref:Ubiquitin-activating enzyme SCCH domain-containing protein n=1 Tax=Didymodactylos carnosus TaxID=1234261 RepID=A0A8S2P826_9BILA|nr:unnamed protein product [Didymodactylos carnosus]CAF4041416.1 unnamed protein product [Didymodactylos carnosus]
MKRCPYEIKFDPKNTLHMDFIYAASNLCAEMYNISQVKDRHKTQDYVATIELPGFIPKEDVTIYENDEQMNANNEMTFSNENETVETQQKMLKLPNLEGILNVNLKPLEFEKDDDTNFHIDFITAASNLRAKNYEIEPVERSRIKQIAGRIYLNNEYSIWDRFEVNEDMTVAELIEYFKVRPIALQIACESLNGTQIADVPNIKYKFR